MGILASFLPRTLHGSHLRLARESDETVVIRLRSWRTTEEASKRRVLGGGGGGGGGSEGRGEDGRGGERGRGRGEF